MRLCMNGSLSSIHGSIRKKTTTNIPSKKITMGTKKYTSSWKARMVLSFWHILILTTKICIGLNIIYVRRTMLAYNTYLIFINVVSPLPFKVQFVSSATEYPALLSCLLVPKILTIDLCYSIFCHDFWEKTIHNIISSLLAIKIRHAFNNIIAMI